MIRMVVFDMAGTVVNEDNVVYKTLRTAINEAGYTFSLDQVLMAGAGKEKFQAVKDILSLSNPDYNVDQAAAIFANFTHLLKAAYETFPIVEQTGASRVFESLRAQKILVVLNTGYSRETAESLLKKLKWEVGNEIDLMVTASDVPRNRPFPDMIHYAMRHYNITNAGQVMKVGDSVIDIEEGRNAGCGITVGITTGAHTRDQLETATPDHIVEALDDLTPIISLHE